MDAESKENLVYKGKRYVYEATGIDEGKHQLAMKLAKIDGTVSFPSTVIMIGNNVVYKNNSFMSKKEVMKILTNVSETYKSNQLGM
ncbi:hypothetical protein CW751_06290 [Brumimicrobium salinarum]|uniref:Thioredoxin-like fold domain-containing protein n=1 Tax=Brumimicrobium salinarum TaxID=2058658 RepID=A0A2I0R3P5_9FLAO|nr:hypothetical protein [Brumimicrobium salinarum]PKR81191.1 hypothetical protein CW751_06290 [Brumimicrobium salinarum]